MIKRRSEFEDLTRAELSEAVEAYDTREKWKWIRNAWFTSLTMMAFTGKWIEPSSLLPDWIVPTKVLTKEEKDRELKELKKELKIED